MMGDLSAKAYGFLLAIHQHDLNISAESMMVQFKVGRRSALSGLKELRENEYIRTTRQRIGNRIMTVSILTEKANRAFFGSVKAQLVESHNVTSDISNEHISRITNSTVISKKPISTKSRVDLETEEFEVKNMSGWGGLFSPGSGPDDDLVGDMKKHIKNIAAEKEELNQKSKEAFRNAKTALGIDRRVTRQEKPTSEWKVPDVCFEFADRIEQYFHIQPWKVTQSKFSGALAGLRKRLDTNGEIEVAVMDLFFKQININEYKDAEVLWRLYVSRFGSLVGQVVMSLPTEQSQEVARKARDKARKALKENDV
jgi:hypothetical protein